MSKDANKRRAAEAALDYLKDGFSLGVGTGSTAEHFIAVLAAHKHRLGAVVSSSERTTQKLREVGIEPVELATTGDVDLYVDGADEATKHRYLVKGGGGALTREKILAAASRKFVCIVDDSKLVGLLGGFPLPIEVLPVAQSFVARQMIKAGGQPIWRPGFVTDNGNHIIDVHNLKITNPPELETRFNQIPGIVTVGLFAHRRPEVLLIGTDNGVTTIQ